MESSVQLTADSGLVTTEPQPDVTVIIAAYNAMPYVVATVESVLGQTLGQGRIEILVIDDGSTDGTGEALDRLAADAPCLRVIHQANSGGPAKPRNRALGIARGRYVFVLDADDRLGEEALERMVKVADAQGTDVVLGRMVGVGGRGVPIWAFEFTELRTNVLDSRAFRTLSPMKMYRKALIDRIGLRFPEDLAMGEDQPFVAHAYFNADGISILGDYDYIYMTDRDDRQNMTLTHMESDANVDSLTRMFEILESYVEPGPDRDRLATRLFLVEAMGSTLVRLVHEPDETVKRKVLDDAKTWVDRWYTDGVSQQLPWLHRVVYETLRHGSHDDVLAVLGAMADGADFRLWHHLESLKWDKGVLVLGGRAGLSGLPFQPTIDIVLKEKGAEASYRVRAQAASESGAFEARIAPLTFADGSRLPEGRWGVSVEAGYHGVSRRSALGADRSESIGPGPFATTVELSTWSQFRVDARFARTNTALVIRVHPLVAGLDLMRQRIRRRLRALQGKRA